MKPFEFQRPVDVAEAIELWRRTPALSSSPAAYDTLITRVQPSAK